MITQTIAALASALAATLGVLFARLWCRSNTPLVDPPPPLGIPWWGLALAAACIGIEHSVRQPTIHHILLLAVILFVLSAATTIDISLGIIPDILTLVPLAAITIIANLQTDLQPTITAAIIALPFCIAALLSRGYGVGWSDVKLAALGAAVLGLSNAIVGLTLASAVAFIVSKRRPPHSQPIAFAPYIAAGIGLMLMMGLYPSSTGF
jgi:prepilin signal peptidase PulO-like enzyme (type II secretory pathway)